MAVSSSGGGEATQTGGVVQASGGAEGSVVVTPAATAVASDTPEGIAQAAAEKAAYDAEHGGTPAATTEEGQQATTEEPATTEEAPQAEAPTDEPKVYKTLEEVPAERIEEIKGNLKTAGGLFADPRYETAALEFETLGSVSDATKAATAEAFGVPVEAVQQFIDGQLAQRQLASAQPKGAAQGEPTAAEIALGVEIVKAFPGDNAEADYTAFMQWGKTGLSASEQAAYNAALNRGDTATVGVLLQAFKGKYAAEGNGPGPRDLTTEAQAGNQAPEVKGFASSDEMTKAMADPRYKTDPAYNAEVGRRVMASKY